MGKMLFSYVIWPLHLFVILPTLQYLVDSSSYTKKIAKKQTLKIIIVLIVLQIYGIIAGFLSWLSLLSVLLLSLIVYKILKEEMIR
jgi:hypothetical protein